MEINIRTECPNCREKIALHYCTDKKVERPTKFLEDSTFDLIKKFSIKASEKNENIFDEIIKIIDESKISAIDYIKNHFADLEKKALAAENPKELKKLLKELSKTKVIVAKGLQQEVESQKKRISDSIKERIKKINRKG